MANSKGNSEDLRDFTPDIPVEAVEKEEAPMQEAELVRLKADLETSKNSHLRLMADFENFKKRNKSIARDMYNEGIIDTVEKLLPVLDSIDRAISMAKSDAEKEGVVLIQKMFFDTFEKMNIKEITAQGEVFDPNFHNAVMQVEDSENAGKVVGVLQKGYMLGDKVIRHAMVQVAN